jgi:hypothetical protein
MNHAPDVKGFTKNYASAKVVPALFDIIALTDKINAVEVVAIEWGGTADIGLIVFETNANPVVERDYAGGAIFEWVLTGLISRKPPLFSIGYIRVIFAQVASTIQTSLR